MDTDKQLRKHLIKMLEGGDAHATFDDAVADLPAALQGKTPKSAEHSPWQLLEHLRIAQRDTRLLADDSTDLFAKIPHGDGQTILRQALLAADHNAYHLGQFVLVRRLLGAWK
jgi:hypothetical protein